MWLQPERFPYPTDISHAFVSCEGNSTQHMENGAVSRGHGRGITCKSFACRDLVAHELCRGSQEELSLLAQYNWQGGLGRQSWQMDQSDRSAFPLGLKGEERCFFS